MRYSKWLSEDGVFIVRIWDGQGKLRKFVTMIEKNFDIAEEYRHKNSGTVVLVFRCHSDAKR